MRQHDGLIKHGVVVVVVQAVSVFGRLIDGCWGEKVADSWPATERLHSSSHTPQRPTTEDLQHTSTTNLSLLTTHN
jgi:hypothetical protein